MTHLLTLIFSATLALEAVAAPPRATVQPAQSECLDLVLEPKPGERASCKPVPADGPARVCLIEKDAQPDPRAPLAKGRFRLSLYDRKNRVIRDVLYNEIAWVTEVSSIRWHFQRSGKELEPKVGFSAPLAVPAPAASGHYAAPGRIGTLQLGKNIYCLAITVEGLPSSIRK